MKFSHLTPEEIRHTWQARILRGSRGRMRAIALSVISHSCNIEELAFLMKVALLSVYVPTPFYSSAARISGRGRVYCRLVTEDGEEKTVVVFKHKKQMEGAFRYLADKLYLGDAMRVEMFAAVNKWVVCDYRVDPYHPEDKIREVA